MTQITLLRSGKWSSDLATDKEFIDKVTEIREIIESHNWWEKKFYIYGRVETISEFFEEREAFLNRRTYKATTHASKQVLIAEFNGLIKHFLNSWLEKEAAPKIKMIITEEASKNYGKVIEVPITEDIDFYEQIGFAKRV